MEEKITYQLGIPEAYRPAAVALYEEAFGKKMSVAIKDPTARKQVFSDAMSLEYGIGAISNRGLVGIAGFHTKEGSLTSQMTFQQLQSRLGLAKACWALLIFSLYHRSPAPGELLMDGIAVHSSVRGRGVGSGLLKELYTYARERGIQSIRLDVIDTNLRAKTLYEREGFETVKTERFPLLSRLLGFGGSSSMRLKLK